MKKCSWAGYVTVAVQYVFQAWAWLFVLAAVEESCNLLSEITETLQCFTFGQPPVWRCQRFEDHNSGICSCIQWLYMCVSKCVVTYSMSCVLVDFFSLHKYKTLTHSHILNYRCTNPILQVTDLKKWHAHIFAPIVVVYFVQNIFVHLSQTMWTCGQNLNICKSECELVF